MGTEAGDTTGVADSYGVLIDMFKADGDFVGAAKLAKESVTALHDAGDIHGEAYALLKLGELFIDSGENTKAGKVGEVAMGMFAGLNDMQGMMAGKELMDGAKSAGLIADIETTLSAASEYMHIPSTLIVDPGLNKRIQERYSQAVSGV